VFGVESGPVTVVTRSVKRGYGKKREMGGFRSEVEIGKKKNGVVTLVVQNAPREAKITFLGLNSREEGKEK